MAISAATFASAVLLITFQNCTPTGTPNKPNEITGSSEAPSSNDKQTDDLSSLVQSIGTDDYTLTINYPVFVKSDLTILARMVGV